jgi:hypothetical protein
LAVLRVNFAKAHARMERWREELELVPEEMRRSIQYTIWKAAWWKEQAERRDIPGTRSYAMREASLWLRFGRKLTDSWTPTLKRLGHEQAVLGFPEVPVM